MHSLKRSQYEYGYLIRYKRAKKKVLYLIVKHASIITTGLWASYNCYVSERNMVSQKRQVDQQIYNLKRKANLVPRRAMKHKKIETNEAPGLWTVFLPFHSRFRDGR